MSAENKEERPILTEAEIDAEVEKFIDQYTPHGVALSGAQKALVFKAIKEGNPETFSDTLLWLTKTDEERAAEYGDAENAVVPDRYMMYATHARRDYECTEEAKGDSGYCKATFIGSMLVGRYQPDQGDPVPDHVGIKDKGDVHGALSSIELQADGSYTSGDFFVRDQDTLKQLYDLNASINWDEAVTACYAAAPLSDGKVYSPAWNSLFLVFENDEYKDDTQAVMWIMHSATADGSPAEKYPGPALSNWWISEAGLQFTPFADAENWYGYQLLVGNDIPNAENQVVLFTVKAFHKDGGVPSYADCEPNINSDESNHYMYLQVTNGLIPATEVDIANFEKHLKGDIEDALELAYAALCKGALVFDIAKTYYPDKTNGELMDIVNMDDSGDVTIGDRITGTILDIFATNNSDALWVVPPGPGDERELSREELRRRLGVTARNLVRNLNNGEAAQAPSGIL